METKKPPVTTDHLRMVLDFLARTDLDGRYGGASLVWSILSGLAFLAVLFAIACWIRAATSGGPRRVTRVVHRAPAPTPEPVWKSTTSQPTDTPSTTEREANA